MTAAETIRALRDALADERRAAEEHAAAAVACALANNRHYTEGWCPPCDRRSAVHSDAEGATDDILATLAAAVDAAPALTPELRAALDALVEADRERAKAREDYSAAWKGDTSRLGEIGQRLDRATEARIEAAGAIIALWGAS